MALHGDAVWRDEVGAAYSLSGERGGRGENRERMISAFTGISAAKGDTKRCQATMPFGETHTAK